LSLPPADARTAKEAGSFEAVRLFCERAAAIEPSFTLDDTDVGAVVSICRRLDGMPLAIELAVARLSSLSVTEIDGRLHRRFRLLTGGSRVLLRRQQTLETAIDWSHDLLNEAERAVLRRVSTFLGGFDLLAAEAVAADDVSIDADEVLDILDSLVNKSLVLADRGGASVRFSLLETIREYGKERLADAGDGDSVATKGRHARYYLSVVEQAAKHSNTESQQEWLARLDLEHDNIRTALLEFTARGQPGPALRMGSGAASYWKVRGHYREGIELLTKALENRAAPDELRAAALLAKGTLLSSIGDLALAQESLAECAAATGDNADPAFISKLEYEEAYICFKFGRHEEASARADQAVTSAKLSGNPSLIALALSRRASLTTEPSSDARSELVEAMKYFNQAGDEMQAIQCLHDLGLLELETGDPAAARVHFEEALRATERLGDFDSLPYLAVNSGWADLLLGDIDAARHAATRALTLCRRRGDRDLLPYAVLVVALCASRSGDWEAAAQLHGAADLLLGIVDQPFEPFEADLRQKDQTELVEALGRPAFDRAYDAGGAGAVDNVLERALRLCTVESHVTERSR
jgi:non-specific serine/threonine protein kinase